MFRCAIEWHREERKLCCDGRSAILADGIVYGQLRCSERVRDGDIKDLVRRRFGRVFPSIEFPGTAP